MHFLALFALINESEREYAEKKRDLHKRSLTNTMFRFSLVFACISLVNLRHFDVSTDTFGTCSPLGFHSFINKLLCSTAPEYQAYLFVTSSGNAR